MNLVPCELVGGRLRLWIFSNSVGCLSGHPPNGGLDQNQDLRVLVPRANGKPLPERRFHRFLRGAEGRKEDQLCYFAGVRSSAKRGPLPFCGRKNTRRGVHFSSPTLCPSVKPRGLFTSQQQIPQSSGAMKCLGQRGTRRPPQGFGSLWEKETWWLPAIPLAF